MSAGLQVFGAGGSVQLDESFATMGFVSSGTLTLTLDVSAAHPNPMYVGDIVVTGNAPVLAFASADTPINIERCIVSGSTHTYKVRTQSYAPVTVKYWIFDVAGQSQGSSSPQFLEVNDQYGVMTYHGGQTPFRVVDQIYIAPPPTTWTGSSYEGVCVDTRTYTAGRTYAVVQCALCARPEVWIDPEPEYYVEPGYRWMNHRYMHSAATVHGATVNVGLEVFESFKQQDPISQPEEAWRVGSLLWLVLDVTGLGSGPGSSDVTPNAIDWPNVSLSTTSHTGTQIGTSRTLSGITSSIGLRVEVSDYSGNLATGSIILLRNGSSAGSINMLTGGYFDATVSNSDVLAFQVAGTTTAGSKSGSATVTVKNLSTGGTTLDTFTASAAVDTDNNYNMTDLTPDAVNWPNLSNSSNSESAQAGAGFYQTFSGITDPINVRVSISSVSSNFNYAALFCYDTGTYYGSPSISNGAYIDRTFHPGDALGFIAHGETYSGIKSGSWTVTVTNLSTGATLDTFTVSLTADADNNYNLADYTPDAVSWPGLYGSASSWQVNPSNGYQTFTGITAPISVRVYFGYYYHDIQGDWTGASSGDGMWSDTSGQIRLHIYRNGAYSGVSTDWHYLYGSYSGAEQFLWADITIYPGDTVGFASVYRVYPNDDWGVGRATMTVYGGVYLDNLSDGGARITSFSHTGILNRPYG